MRRERIARGLTLVELMISMTLGLLLVAGLATVFVATNRSFRQNELIAGMQDQGRFALSQIARDLSMAGYWGGMLGTDNVVPNLYNVPTTDDVSSATVGLPTTRDCGPAGTPWSFKLDSRVEFRNQGAASTVVSMWNCINHWHTFTDIFAVRRVAGQATGSMVAGDSTVKLRPYQFYLQTNATIGTLVRWGAAATASPEALAQPPLPPMTMYRYYPRIYYVRDFSRTPGDNIPTLCRKELCPSGFTAKADPELSTCGAAGASPASAGYFPECIAEGVEDMEIVWGLDSTDDTDDVVDRYTSTPTPTELAQQARMAQIYLLVRSRKGDAAHTDDKTYQIADKPAFTPSTVTDPAGTPKDMVTGSYYRRVYSTTVQLRNPIN